MPSEDWEHLAYGQHPSNKMTELSFARSFLSTLDSRPIKVQSDYAVDLRTYEPQGPYTLPRMPKSMRKPEQAAAPGSAPALKVTLKSLRNPPLELTLPAEPATTSVLELKQRVARELELPSTEKIRLIFRKKPCADSKTIGDLVSGNASAGEAEFSVMVIGGLPAKEASAAKNGAEDAVMEDAPVAQGESGLAVMEGKEFWRDLEGFLLQRIRDEAVAKKATELFHGAWKRQG